MAAITPDDVRRIAELAALRMGPDEVDRMARELASILEHMQALGEAPIDDVDATGGRGSAPLRADRPDAERLAEPPGTGAPAWQDGFFTVPRLASHDVEAEESSSGETP
jgi:aspartyl-tRNA(Asn)/glutamyl-tRNA(Gln) amidotransferase subunit C